MIKSKNGPTLTRKDIKGINDRKKVIISGAYSKIGEYAFAGSEITMVEIQDGVIEIENGAFAGCPNLKTVILPKTIKTIGSEAFAACSSLTVLTPKEKNIINENQPRFEIPDTVEEIGIGAFQDCARIQGIDKMSKKIQTILPLTFYGCNSLERAELPHNLTSIDRSAFKWCIGLKHGTLPPTVSKVHREAFYGCESMEDFECGEQLTFIGPRAFEGCSKLVKIDFNKQLRAIGDGAFKRLLLFTRIRITN